MRSGDHGSDGRGAALVAGLRAHSLAGFAHHAEHLRRVWAITKLVHGQEGWRVGDGSRADALGCGRITEHDLDVLAAAEVAAATGLSQFEAERDVVVARAVCTVLTATLGALAAGRVDARRVRVLAEETTGLTDRQARKVEAAVLDGLPALPLDGTGPVGPWDGPTPAGVHQAGPDRGGEGPHRRRGAGPPRRAGADRDPHLDAPGEPGPVDHDGHRTHRPGPDHRHHPGGRQPVPDP